jgi:hypothetical protein
VVLPSLKARLLTALRDFNWSARKDALYAALVGESRYCEVLRTAEGKQLAHSGVVYRLRIDASVPCGEAEGTALSATASAVKKASGGTARSSQGAKSKGGAKNKAPSVKGSAVEQLSTVFESMAVSTEQVAQPTVAAINVLKGNLFAQLRQRGVQDVLRTVFSYV